MSSELPSNTSSAEAGTRVIGPLRAIRMKIENVARWLENGCHAPDAARELRLIAAEVPRDEPLPVETRALRRYRLGISESCMGDSYAKLIEDPNGEFARFADLRPIQQEPKALRQADITDVRPLDLEKARHDVADVIAEELKSEGFPTRQPKDARFMTCNMGYTHPLPLKAPDSGKGSNT